VKKNEWAAKFSGNAKLPDPEPMSHEEKEAKINVPIYENILYEDLLC
jgi:hypothetical protein